MSSVLLVEGASDVDFFAVLLKRIGLGRVEIKPPRNFGSDDNDFQNTVTVYPQLLDTLLPDLETGQITRLGIVADADHPTVDNPKGGGGFRKRWRELTATLEEHGYQIPPRPPTRAGEGSVFVHEDELPDVGLWLMPDHRHDGMLEDLILQSITDDAGQKGLSQRARDTVAKLPEPRFSSNQKCKAEVYTWLAWQKRPGQGLDIAMNGDLLNLDAPVLSGLRRWLQDTFPRRS